jgi:hypothetical protein
MTDFSRRKLISSTIGMALAGPFGARDAMANSNAGSPSNPHLLYKFNAKNLGLTRPSVAMSFSRSGQYLAILSEGSFYGPPEFVVWDVSKRKALFRTSDTSIVPDSSTGFEIQWGPNDGWIAFTESNKGVLTLFDPKNGQIVDKLQLHGHNYKFNNDATKIVYTKRSQDLSKKGTVIFDLNKKTETYISISHCVSGLQASPEILQWYNNDKIIAVGGGFIGKGRECNAEEIEKRKKYPLFSETSFYYVSIIDSNDDNDRSVKVFEEKAPWYRNSIITSTDNKFSILDDRFIINMDTFELAPLSVYKEKPSGDSSAFGKNDILYSVNSGELFETGFIIDVKENRVIGTLPKGNERSIVSVNNTYDTMAVSVDGVVSIYHI